MSICIHIKFKNSEHGLVYKAEEEDKVKGTWERKRKWCL